jgi:hypothetical protein
MRRVLHTVVVLSITAGPLHAEPTDASAVAEQLFNQARELTKANQWAEACAKFEASLRYDPVLGTRLNLATCYEHVGKLASAWGLYRETIALAKKAGDTKRRDYAEKQAAAIEPRIPKLAISAPANPPAGFVMRRDGAQIDTGAQGVALFVDPGPHEIAASAPGFEPYAQTLTMVEGKTTTLAIPDLKPASTPAGPVGPPRPPLAGHAGTTEPRVVASEPAASRSRTYAAIGAGAAGVAAVAVGLVFGVKASSTYGDATKLCGSSLVCGSADYSKGQQLVRDAHSSATISTVAVVAGGAAIVAGVVLWLTAPRSREAAHARLVPLVRDRDAGLAVAGSF